MSKLQEIEIAGDLSNTVTLPEHLIIEHILPRLPVKTLIRFKSVSKLWLSSISSPQFVKSHLHCSSSSSSDQFLLLVRNKKRKKKGNRISLKLLLLLGDELNNLKTPLDLGFPQLDLCFSRKTKVDVVDIVGSCNGLVCLNIFLSLGASLLSSFLYVYNPATQENRKIINPEGCRSTSLNNRFGYLPSVDDYRVFSSFYDCNNGDIRRFYVYSLRIGKWQVINDLNGYLPSVSDKLSYSTTIFDDVLYSSLKGTSIGEKRIVAIDLVNVEWKEFPWMDWLNEYKAAYFFVKNGCLSLLCWSYSSCYQIGGDVWTLKKHNDWSSWEKSFYVHLGYMDYIYGVTPSGKFIFGIYSKHFKIVGLNNKNTQQLSKGDGYFSKEEIKGAIGYVESLVSPFGTIEPEEEDHHEV